MEPKTLKEIIQKYSQEIKKHIEAFGKGKNRDIDTREKGTITIMPVVIEKRIKLEAIKIFLKKYNPNGRTITDKDWLEFFNITEDDLLEEKGE